MDAAFWQFFDSVVSVSYRKEFVSIVLQYLRSMQLLTELRNTQVGRMIQAMRLNTVSCCSGFVIFSKYMARSRAVTSQHHSPLTTRYNYLRYSHTRQDSHHARLSAAARINTEQRSAKHNW